VPHYTILLEQHQQHHGKPLAPVKRKAGKRKPPPQARCQWCEAPAKYLSINDGKKQVYCKVCELYSNYEKQLKDITITCPHCNKTLEKMVKDTEKNGYLYFKCRNKNCPYFSSNKTRLKKLANKQKTKFKKLHYIYRKPIIDITSLHPNSPDKPKVDLAQVRSSAYVVGLILTYRAMGQSNRTIATLMEEIHEVAISHQTVKNYLDAAAYRLAPLVLNYPYDLSGILTADETYIRVIGNWNYLTWSFDPKAQIIAALNVSQQRNLIELAKAINHAVSKFSFDVLTEQADFNPLLVTDGNPVYQLIVQFLRQANIFINHKIVIGLENNDDQSADFRNLKQIIERLNKNFKKYINNSEYFGSTNGLLSAALIFTAHFNFIRKNSVLGGNIPVSIPTINSQQNQPCRWIRLLEYAQIFCQQQQ
jgi:transposase-like protein